MFTLNNQRNLVYDEALLNIAGYIVGSIRVLKEHEQPMAQNYNWLMLI